jgi:hypothetical protein
MNYQNLNKMGNWERQKAIYLLQVADELKIDYTGFGEIAVNQNSGYTYLWCEDYPFTLYMPISCKLEKSDVWVMWTNPEDGEEIEITLDNKTLDDLYKWVESLEKEVEDTENE